MLTSVAGDLRGLAIITIGKILSEVGMELEMTPVGLEIPVLLILAAVAVGVASLMLHLLFPPSRNTPDKR